VCCCAVFISVLRTRFVVVYADILLLERAESWNNQNRKLPSDNAELAARLQGRGDVKWFATFTFESALRCRTLIRRHRSISGWNCPARQGLANYADMMPLTTGAPNAVSFLGGVVQGNTGVSGCISEYRPLIPIQVVRTHFTNFSHSRPGNQTGPRGFTERIAADLYAALEREVRLWLPGFIGRS
jgi:hypothetical protein